MNGEIRKDYRKYPPTEWTEKELEHFREEAALDDEEHYEQELKNNPPVPPWLAYPEMDKTDIGWRMGPGESHLNDIYVYFEYCGKESIKKYVDKYPEPESWEGWYERANLYI